AHHAKTTSASELTSGVLPSIDRLPAIGTGKIWQGNANRPVEVDSPSIPSGLITMWHGLIANIPSGWLICDGNNSTPNLLTRFVQGVVTAATNPGATGGAKSKTTSGHIHSVPIGLTKQTQGSDATPRYYARLSSASSIDTASKTDRISDIRPEYYDVAFLMKT
ncbi:unnamed protein product, partial [marine sediment metagenome]